MGEARKSQVSEKGYRDVSQTTLDAPTFKYVCLVSFCPGCGACAADYWKAPTEKAEHALTELTFKDPESGKQIKNYFEEAKKKPSNAIECAKPVQMKMPEKGDKPERKLPLYKNPDFVCTAASFICCWRLGLTAGLMLSLLPLMLAAKYGLGVFAMGTICFCLTVTAFAALVRCCKPDWFSLESPDMRHVFLSVVDMKVKDKQMMKEAEAKGTCALAQHVVGLVCHYASSLLKGFLCCQFFRPSIIFVFGKTLFAMVFTDIAMVVSAYIYAAVRFTCGSLCWTSCSLMAWTRAFMNDVALKDRILTFRYPAWIGEGTGEDVESQNPEGCGCFGACVNFICGLPCCSICDCKLCCSIMCPLFCTMFSVWLQGVAEGFSALLLVGKALIYTNRIMPRKTSITQVKPVEDAEQS
jgi:hypothetical protein